MRRMYVGLAATFVMVALVAGVVARAAQPRSGTLRKKPDTVTWTGAAPLLTLPNPAGCLAPSDPTCDAFELTVNLKAGSNFIVAIDGKFDTDDYDLIVFYPDGSEAGRAATEGGNESIVITHTTSRGVGPYHVRVLPFLVQPGSTYQGIARSTRAGSIEATDLLTCTEAVPDTVGLPFILGLSPRVSLEVALLVEGVSVDAATAIMTQAASSYAAIGIDVTIVSINEVSFVGTEGAALIQQSRDFFGGARPTGSDLVYLLSAKDLTNAGDPSLAGLADCIGGVRFPTRAFAVGEAVGIDPLLIGPFGIDINAHPEIAAHEIGHLMGAHHHYANCVEGILEGAATDLSPCTLMFNAVDFTSLNFSQVNGPVVRGHAERYAQ